MNNIEIYSDNLEKQKLINFGNNNDYLFSIVKNYKLEEILKKIYLIINTLQKLIIKKINYSKGYDLIINTDYNHPITKNILIKKLKKNTKVLPILQF